MGRGSNSTRGSNLVPSMEILCKSTLVMKAQSDVVLELLYVMASTGEKNHLICSMFRTEFCAEHPKLTGSAYPKVRWSARRALRSRGGVGRFERGLVSRRAREAEKRDGEVRFSVRPCLPELGLGLPSFHSRPPSLFVEYPGPNA